VSESRESAERSAVSSTHSDTEPTMDNSARRKRRRAASDSRESPLKRRAASSSPRRRAASVSKDTLGQSDAEPATEDSPEETETSSHVILRSTVTHIGRTTVALKTTTDQQNAAEAGCIETMSSSKTDELQEPSSKQTPSDDKLLSSEPVCQQKHKPVVAAEFHHEDYDDASNGAFHKSIRKQQDDHYVSKLHNSSRDIGALGLTSDKMALVREKKDDIEKAYRQDCETFATVTKMLINKDPGLEDRIQFSLRENLKDIGKRCIHELRSFIDGLRAEMEDEECF
jgi:hypothetical protein